MKNKKLTKKIGIGLIILGLIILLASFNFSYFVAQTITPSTCQTEYIEMTSHLSAVCDTNFPMHITPNSDLVITKANELTIGISDKWDKAETLFDYVHSIPYPTECDAIINGKCYYGWWKPDLILSGEKTTADCKTKSALFVSLMRASGFSEREIFIISSVEHMSIIVKVEDVWMPVDCVNFPSFWHYKNVPQCFEPDPRMGNDKYEYEKLYTPYCIGSINVNIPEDPCKDITCSDYCKDDYAYSNSICIDGECQYTKTYCNYGCKGSQCKTELGVGDRCYRLYDCNEPLICYAGICLKEDGTSCLADWECVSDACVSGVCQYGFCDKEGEDCSIGSCCSGLICQSGEITPYNYVRMCHSGNWCSSDSDCNYCYETYIGVYAFKTECEYQYSRDYKTCDWLYPNQEKLCVGCIDNKNYYSGCENGECLIEPCLNRTYCENGKCKKEPTICNEGVKECISNSKYWVCEENNKVEYDCPTSTYCKDGNCLPQSEDCGNGICEPTENPKICPQDCRIPPPPINLKIISSIIGGLFIISGLIMVFKK